MSFFRHFLLGCVALLQTTGALACAICAPPDSQNTLVARIVSADAVVIAQTQPGSELLQPVLAVRGMLPDKPFPASGLVAREADGTGLPPTFLALYQAGSSSWRVIGKLGMDRVGWLRKVIEMPRGLDASSAQMQQRVLFFASDLESPVGWLAQAAYEEIAAMPLAVMRALGPVLQHQKVQAWAVDPLLRERWPLYGLLWGVVATAADESTLKQRLQDPALALSVAERSALLAALIEMRQTQGVQWVEQNYLRDATSPDTVIQSALLALSVHGNDPARVERDSVVQAYAKFIHYNPQRAGMVASDLGNWERWEFAGTYAALLRSGGPQQFVSRYAMLLYLLRNPLPEAKILLEKLRDDGLV